MATRFADLVALVPGLTYGELDLLAGATSEGHAKQIAAGKEPRRATALRYAAVLGCTGGYLLFGEGAAPAERTVRIAVMAARRELDRRHAPKVAHARSARKKATCSRGVRSAPRSA